MDDGRNSAPVPPEGFDASEPARSTDLIKASQGAAPAGRPTREATREHGYVWCALGGATLAYATLLPCILIGYGTTLASIGGRRRARALCLALAVIGTLVSIPLGIVSSLPTIIAQAVTCFAIACLVVDEKDSLSSGSAVCAVSSVACLAIGAAVAAASGTTLAAAMDEVVAAYVQGATTVSADTSLASVMAVLKTYWPMAYVLQAATIALLAFVGGRIALRRLNLTQERPFSLAKADAPLWSVGLLIVALVLLVYAQTGAGWSSVASMVGANLVMCARAILCVQGLGVVASLLDRTSMGGFARGLCYLLAVILEVSMFVLSVVGLVDVWANFRHLDRDGVPAQAPDGDKG